jgi:type IX secretion system PorP/SprF family membrane protein
MLTQFSFNNLLFNPACAGINDHLALTATHRHQWLGIDGAPVGQTISVHSPLSGKRIALGGSLTHDKIGPTETFELSTDYAYRFPIGDKMQLSAGLQASIANWHGDWFNVFLEDGIDAVFQHNQSRWLANFGVGLFLYNDRFYAGISSPRLIEHDLRRAASSDYSFYAKTYRHYYTTIGASFPVDDQERIVIKPALLLKSTGWFSSFRRDETFQNIGSPTELDLDCSVFFNNTLRVGASWRTAVEMKRSSAASANLWAMYYLLNGLRFGASYDLTLSKLRQAATNSVEIVVGYEFDIKVKKVSSPRYF